MKDINNPPRKPALDCDEQYPITRPGIIPGRPEIEYATPAVITATAKSIANVPILFTPHQNPSHVNGFKLLKGVAPASTAFPISYPPKAFASAHNKPPATTNGII